ncbi:MAG: glycoside hydrolase family 3 protein [bacterium]|nr:glycoside hydrolase family 3 protein [bacterium]
MNLEQRPFRLSEEERKWVEDTYRSMSLEEKIGQLFCPIGYSTEPEYLKYELLGKHIGGLFFRDGVGKEMQETFAYAQANSRIPLLIPSNLEAGGDGAATDGTPYGKQMEVAAADDPLYAYRLGKIATGEAAALGINWAFAPVVDIDMNFRNPITNVRTYGSDKEKVVQNALAYLRAAKENQVAVSVKHFPGDGVDERDQHILTSVNSLSMEEWDETFGYVYRKMIEADALTVMVGHIAMPAYQEFYNPEMKGRIVPATLSKELLGNLLREKLGFNGLIITDATPMVGYTAAMERKKAIPTAIEAGCDMILFNKDLAEDYEFMMAGYRSGILSDKRLTEAVYRILATKAALKLPVKKQENRLVPGPEALQILGCEEHVKWARELADRAVTLVKDTQDLLPISPQKHKRVLLEVLGDCASDERVLQTAKEELERRGFTVIPYEKEDFAKGVDNVTKMKEKYDLVLYLGNVENASNKTTNRINWYTFYGQGNNLPWFVREVPTVFASLANPYHLFDVPMIQTYVNCYSNHQYAIEALIEKLCGESAFRGISPVDVFCGRKELAY